MSDRDDREGEGDGDAHARPAGDADRSHDPALPWEDRCEVPHDARIVHPHGPGRQLRPGARHDHEAGGAGHHHHLRLADRKRLALTVGITGVVFVAEVVGGLLSRSLALLSDAGHMLTDLSAQVLSLLALLFALRPADARRTYGYYRLEILAALANGVALALLAIFIVYRAWQRLGAPPEVHTGILIGVAAVGLVANLVGAWLLHGAESLNVRGAYLHIVSDALSSIAVLAGGFVMAWREGLYILDPILGIAIGLVVMLGAYRLVREAADVLLEAVPSDIDLERVRADVRQIDGIEDVHDLHIWTITSGLRALSAHIVVHGGSLATANDALLTRIKALLLERHRIAHSTLQIESPDYEHVSHLH